MRGDILKAGGAALICTCVGAGVSACAMVSETSSMPTVPPKASVGGSIGLVRDGDMITIDISRRSLVLHVTDDEMERRKAAWKPIAPKVDSRYLHRYSQQVGSVWEGAVWKDPQDLSPA